MTAQSYFAKGQWNFICDLCGAQNKSSDGVKTWNNLWVCRHHKEIRNPQDFLPAVRDDQRIPWSRPEAPDTFVKFCTLRGRTAMPGIGIPGCLTPAQMNLSWNTSGQLP